MFGAIYIYIYIYICRESKCTRSSPCKTVQNLWGGFVCITICIHNDSFHHSNIHTYVYRKLN